MHITHLHIENFRSIKNLDVDLSESTVFIGPNNAGKTAILEAIRIALTRRWGKRGTGFTEYDIHLSADDDDPRESRGVVIEIRAEEMERGEWLDDLQDEFLAVVRVDPDTGRRSIVLRLTCAWNEEIKAYDPTWEFMSVDRRPFPGEASGRLNLDRFGQHLPVFYLGALRDAYDEFSGRSQFWGRLLRSIQIPPQLEARVQRVLGLVNRKLLSADPKLSEISETVAGATRIATRDDGGSGDLSLVPLKTWDLLSNAGIALRSDSDSPLLPLQRHGQGLQSLSVIFLFQAFVDHLLGEYHLTESTPVLALEEPETHLHPQAARTFGKQLSDLRGQKIVTTHSPYFLQSVRFRDLRIVRLFEGGTEVRWLRSTFETEGIPDVGELHKIIDSLDGRLAYDQASEILTVKGRLDEETYRKLLKCFGSHAERMQIQGALKRLRDESRVYITDNDLESLETWARRMRGGVFFADRWMIVEGQADFLIVNALAGALGYDFDQHGVALIDAKNPGNPAKFAALARALGIPWLAVFDGDPEGQKYINDIRKREFPEEEVQWRCRIHTNGNLEQQLAHDLGDRITPFLRELGENRGLGGDTLTDWLHRQSEFPILLANEVTVDPSFAEYLPEAFRTTIHDLRTVT